MAAEPLPLAEEARRPLQCIPSMLQAYEGSNAAPVFAAVASHFDSRFAASPEAFMQVPRRRSSSACASASRSPPPDASAAAAGAGAGPGHRREPALQQPCALQGHGEARPEVLLQGWQQLLLHGTSTRRCW